jgi:L-amino acid N-acyltransferase YncA
MTIPKAPARITIAPMADDHARAVLEIYALGIATGDATFETEPPPWRQFSAGKLAAHRFVAVEDGAPGPGRGRIAGWVACSPTSSRPAYAGVVEHSVYVHPDFRGRGVGGALLGRLIASTESAGIWTICSGVFPENTASLALHAAHGFRVVGVRERVGRHHGRWRDVILLERRSPLID